MADYKKMYFHLFREVEKAVRILQQAQLDCEEIYISTPGAKSRQRGQDQDQGQERLAQEREAV